MTLQVNGNALTLSNGLWQEMEDAAPELVGDGQARLLTRARWPPSSKGGVHAMRRPSCWRRCSPTRCRTTAAPVAVSGGLDPDRDVRLAVVPPPHTVAHLSGGVIDGYCVGEPWNKQSKRWPSAASR